MFRLRSEKELSNIDGWTMGYYNRDLLDPWSEGFILAPKWTTERENDWTHRQLASLPPTLCKVVHVSGLHNFLECTQYPRVFRWSYGIKLMKKTPYCKLFYSRRVCVCIFVLFSLVTVFRLYSKFSNFAGFYRKYNPTALQTK